MIEIDGAQCAVIQQKCLKMLEYLRDFCTSRGLRFFLCGGALIGAVREGGFLEWDDDADVFMPREDYEKLRECFNREADTSRYVLEFSDGTVNNRHPFMLLRDIGTTLVRENQADLELMHGVAIDLLPLDGCPGGMKRRIQKLRALKFMLYNTGVVPENHGAAVKLGSKILLALVPEKKRYARSKKLESKMSRYPFGSTEYVTELCAGPRYMDNEYSYEDFSETVMLPFAGTKMPAMKGWDGYLKKAFGDYMTPPPETDRLPSHGISYFDPELPASEYLRLRNESKDGFAVSGEQLRELQLKSIELLERFKTLCRQEGLSFCLCGGSLIGAVREGGFLKWDDDIDVFMPRPDYERLASLQDSGEIPAPYCFSRSCANEYTRLQIGAFVDCSTTFIKPRQADLDIPHGIRIDVIPLDGCPAGGLARKAQKYHALLRSLYIVGETHTSGGRLLGSAGRLLLALHPGIKRRIRSAARQERKMTRYPFATTGHITELVTWYRYMVNEYPDGCFAKTVTIPFENTLVPAPADADTYLKMAFGDYMTPPPAQEQVASHDVVFCSTAEPYTKYKGLYYCITQDKINHELKRGNNK